MEGASRARRRGWGVKEEKRKRAEEEQGEEKKKRREGKLRKLEQVIKT